MLLKLVTKRAGLVELRGNVIEGLVVRRELLVPLRAVAMLALVVARAVLALVEYESRAGGEKDAGPVLCQVYSMGEVARIVVEVILELVHVHTPLLDGMAVVSGRLDMGVLLLK